MSPVSTPLLSADHERSDVSSFHRSVPNRRGANGKRPPRFGLSLCLAQWNKLSCPDSLGSNLHQDDAGVVG